MILYWKQYTDESSHYSSINSLKDKYLLMCCTDCNVIMNIRTESSGISTERITEYWSTYLLLGSSGCYFFIAWEIEIKKKNLPWIWFNMNTLCFLRKRVYMFELSIFLIQVAASMQKDIDAHVPSYPNLPSKLICLLHSVTLHVIYTVPCLFFLTYSLQSPSSKAISLSFSGRSRHWWGVCADDSSASEHSEHLEFVVSPKSPSFVPMP